ncbi:O-acetyl-ADP-ribose deacetylase [Chitinophaga caseinilytica]|uniref:O-acetyl-ADP-ribose deacetylase n=1 Tax=Chitinophaga caseinilytica TaxID=2267521 RepID=A0ABZ2Z0F6_9BACT
MQTHLEVMKGDITKVKADAIVNAANTSLLGGGGVDGAIHKAGGPQILEACREIRNRQGGCKVGEAVITTAGNLDAKFVIHTVGPVWNGGKSDEETLLANAYRNSLRLAQENGVTTIAFPNISTGIYRFPKDKAAEIAVATVREFLQEPGTLERVTFVCFDEENYQRYADLLKNASS